MSETIETCRRLHNELLEDRIEHGTNCFAQKRALTASRRGNKFLSAVNAQVLQNVAFRLDNAFERFFAGLSRAPRFKRRGRYNSFTYPQLGGFRIVSGKLRLSRIGLLTAKLTRPIEGIQKTCTIVRDIDRWYACITSEEEPSGQVVMESERPPVGVDLGIPNIVTLSNGKTVENPRFLNSSTSRLKRLQRELSRKKKGSNNQERARTLLAKAWRKVRNSRLDFLHKVSAELAEDYSTIVFEDLRITNMTKNRNLASAIMDASWGELRQLTAYKAERRGGRVILVNPSRTSQKCSRCGEIVKKELSERVHDCPNCGLVINRDVNAARNVLRAGLERACVEEQPLLVQRRGSSMFVPVKQEVQDAKHNGFSLG